MTLKYDLFKFLRSTTMSSIIIISRIYDVWISEMSDLPRPSYRQPCMKLLEGSLAETKSNFKTETFRNRALPQPTALFSLSLAMRVFWSFSLGLLSLADILWKSSFFVSAGEPSGTGSNCQTLRQRREWRIRFSFKMFDSFTNVISGERSTMPKRPITSLLWNACNLNPRRNRWSKQLEHASTNFKLYISILQKEYMSWWDDLL